MSCAQLSSGSPQLDPDHAWLETRPNLFNPLSKLALPLFVARIRCTDHANHSVTANDLAVLADLLDRRTYFHD
jgi:hypothetical protein